MILDAAAGCDLSTSATKAFTYAANASLVSSPSVSKITGSCSAAQRPTRSPNSCAMPPDVRTGATREGYARRGGNPEGVTRSAC